MTEEKWVSPLLDEARKWLGTTEEGSDNCGQAVETFQRDVDGRAYAQSWCMCFALYCVHQAAKTTGLQSWLSDFSFCLTVWNASPLEARLQKPQPGAIVVYQFGNSIHGHAGIVEAVSPDGVLMTTIEGNTSPGVDVKSGIVVERNGDGVYRKTRQVLGTTTMRVKGFLLPFKPVL